MEIIIEYVFWSPVFLSHSSFHLPLFFLPFSVSQLPSLIYVISISPLSLLHTITLSNEEDVTAVTDSSGNTLRIRRDTNRMPVRVVAPDNQVRLIFHYVAKMKLTPWAFIFRHLCTNIPIFEGQYLDFLSVFNMLTFYSRIYNILCIIWSNWWQWNIIQLMT